MIHFKAKGAGFKVKKNLIAFNLAPYALRLLYR